MNIEEARKHLKKNLNNWKKLKKDNGYMPEIMEEINTDYKAIETLLTAYEKEKEKNKELTERVLRLESDKFWDNVVSKDKIKKVIDEESFEVHTREYGTLYVVSSDRLEEELEE